MRESGPPEASASGVEAPRGSAGVTVGGVYRSRKLAYESHVPPSSVVIIRKGEAGAAG
jgi:hypothetical protein